MSEITSEKRAEILAKWKKDGTFATPLKQISLDKLVEITSILVGKDLVPFVKRSVVKTVLDHSKRREYPLEICVNYLKSAVRAEKRKEGMQDMVVNYLGSRDILTQKNNFDPLRVSGHRSLLLVDGTDEIIEATVWDIGPGEEGSRKPLHFWHKIKAKIEETEFTRSSGEKGTGFTFAFIEDEEPADRKDIVERLIKKAIPFDSISSESHMWQPIVIHGRMGGFKPIEDWQPTGEMVPITDADGMPVIDHNTGKARMRAKKEPTAEGQPLIQPRLNNQDIAIYTLAASVSPLDPNEKTVNKLKFRLLNKKFGNHILDLGVGMQEVFADAMQEEDPLDYLSSTYKGTEVLCVGAVTRFAPDDTRDINWVEFEASLVIKVDGLTSGAVGQEITTTIPTTPKSEPQPTPSKEDVAAIASDVAPKVAKVAVETPVVPDALSVPASVSEGEKSKAQIIRQAIMETRELYPASAGIEEIESLELFIMKPYCDAKMKILDEHKPFIKKQLEQVRKEHGDSPVGEKADPAATSLPKAASESGEGPVESMAHVEPTKCSGCGEIIVGNVFDHYKTCKAIHGDKKE